jgi:hypothetical protein
MQLVVLRLRPRQSQIAILKETKTMEGERLLETLLKRICCRAVDLLQLGVELGEPLFGSLVGRLLVGALEPVAPFLLVGLREVTDHVFSLVPLAALDFGPLAEHLSDGLAQPFAAVDDAKNALLEGESSLQKIPQQLHNWPGALGRCLREAKHLLVAFLCNSKADNHLLAGYALPVNPKGQKILLLQGPLFKLLKGLLGSLLKAPAHRGLAQAESVNELTGNSLIIALGETQQDRVR